MTPSLDALLADPAAAVRLGPEARAGLVAQAVSVLAALLTSPPIATNGDDPGAGPAAAMPANTDEYLSIRSLAGRIPYDEQTIRNLMSKGVLKLGVHYFKVAGKGRPIFKWSAVQAWLEGLA